MIENFKNKLTQNDKGITLEDMIHNIAFMLNDDEVLIDYFDMLDDVRKYKICSRDDIYEYFEKHVDGESYAIKFHDSKNSINNKELNKTINYTSYTVYYKNFYKDCTIYNLDSDNIEDMASMCMDDAEEYDGYEYDWLDQKQCD